MGRLPEAKRLAILERLARVDVAAYTGDREMLPEGGLAGILCELEEAKLVTDDVWTVLRKPAR